MGMPALVIEARLRSLVSLVAALAVVLARGVGAQYAPTQDSTLRGLTKVLLVVRSTDDAIGEGAVRELGDVVRRELTSAGFRIAHDSAAVDLAQDGVVNITFSPWEPQDGVTLRMDVMQRARLARTQQSLYMMTWYYEVSGAGAPRKEDSAGGLLAVALKDFLARWRAANRK